MTLIEVLGGRNGLPSVVENCIDNVPEARV
jgi:hypothetical protein